MERLHKVQNIVSGSYQTNKKANAEFSKVIYAEN